MSEIKISEIDEAPTGDGQGRQVKFQHPLTDIPYQLALFRSGERYFCLADNCRMCGSSLVRGGPLNGMYARCVSEGHPWHVKTGLCKFDRTQSLPTYRVQVRDDGLYIEI